MLFVTYFPFSFRLISLEILLQFQNTLCIKYHTNHQNVGGHRENTFTLPWVVLTQDLLGVGEDQNPLKVKYAHSGKLGLCGHVLVQGHWDVLIGTAVINYFELIVRFIRRYSLYVAKLGGYVA